MCKTLRTQYFRAPRLSWYSFGGIWRPFQPSHLKNHEFHFFTKLPTKPFSLLSLGHLLASKMCFISFIHWSAWSGLALPSNLAGWCFKKSSKLHLGGGGWGQGPYIGAPAAFSPTWRRASMCYLWAASEACLVASIYYITRCCCSREALALHSHLMLLQHSVALLRQGCSHSLDCPSKVLPVALWGCRRSYTRGCHTTGHTERTIRNLVRLETHLNTIRKAQRKLSKHIAHIN